VRIKHYLAPLIAALVWVALSLAGVWAQGGPGLPQAKDIGEWIPIAPLLVPRQEVGVAALDEKVYVIAGTQGGIRISSAEVYDPVTRKWALIASLPAPALDHVGAAAVGGKLYAIGGFADSALVRTLFEYDPASNRWTRKADMPTPRGAVGVAVIGGKVYVAGGYASYTAGNSVTDFARYDPATDRWETLPPMPTPRDHFAAVALGGRFHAIGGRRLTGNAGPNVGVHEVFDPATGRWSTLAPLPTPRSGHGAGTLRGRIQVFGGEGNPNRPEGTFAENEEYDPETNTWAALAPMALPRHGTGGAVIGDLLFVPGGGPRERFSDTAEADVFRYRNRISIPPPAHKLPPPADWVRPPSSRFGRPRLPGLRLTPSDGSRARKQIRGP
jgi:N-acetylneuraminic acid mutarotase